MAPLCADPRQIIITLEPAERQALFRLVQEISSYMISQWQTSYEELGSLDPEDEQLQDQGTAGDPPGKTKKKLSAGDSEKAESVQRAALVYALEWRDEFLTKLDELVSVRDGPDVVSERQKRHALLKEQQDGIRREGGDATGCAQEAESRALRALYHPVPTKLATIPLQDRKEALSCILVLLLSTGKYSAHSRILILHLASALRLPQSFINNEEAEIAMSLIESASEKGREVMSADAEAEKRRQENKVSRFWKVGLASVAGAAVIGVTGGLAAPLVAGALGGILGGVGLGGVASFLGVFWMNGALVGTLFGAFGAKMTGGMVDKYAKEVEDFRFLPMDEVKKKSSRILGQREKRSQRQQQRRLRVTIGVSGWLESEDDVTRPWSALGSDSEVFALRYEMEAMLAFGKALHEFIQSMAWKALRTQLIKRTVTATLWAALWPIQVLSVASNVDNPFNRASNRSQKAGQLLADALINRVQGERPVTLVGYSCGATTIHACLQSLAQRQAFGLVDTVVLLGTPAPSDPGHWRAIHPVVSGKIFNVYSENDMVLGFVYRVHSLKLGVAGLQAIRDVQGIENVDLSDRISGHLRYASLTGEILRRCGFDGVNARDEIDKDDVIRLQEQHAHGQLDCQDLVTLDAADGAAPDAAQAADSLRDLTLAAKAPASPPPPPLPDRPAARAAAAESPPSPTETVISRRPLPPQEPAASRLAIPRRPVPSQAGTSATSIESHAAPEHHHPQAQHAGITMIDQDDDADEQEKQRMGNGEESSLDDVEREASTPKLEHRILGGHA